jgi:ribosome biogenesis GTPase / thiamine phosphate phosphatase
MNVDFIPESWGWKQEFFSAWNAAVVNEKEFSAQEEGSVTGPDSVPMPARVTGREFHQYEVVCPDFSGRPGFPRMQTVPGIYGDVRVSGRFDYTAASRAEYPVPGDWVLVECEAGAFRINAVLSRRSALSRTAAGPKTEEQVLAANLDMVCLVFALDGGRNFLERLLERALVAARNSGASVCVVLNKADLAPEEEKEYALAAVAYAAPDVPAVCVSAKTGEGIDILMQFLSPGDTIGVLGKSGVGKSALVNALAAYGSGKNGPGAAQCVAQSTATCTGLCAVDGTDTEKTAGTAESTGPAAKEGHIREADHRGRHTTTSSRLYRLPSGILMIDSPGIRELKIWGRTDSVDDGFPEIAELAGRCRFSDCSHTGEPGCAVLEALAEGQIDESRYRAWLNLQREQQWMERRTNDQARRAEKEKWKRISKFQKELKRSR